jgi:(p)ppGpp synthase/HD superfamily hydrolase
VVVKDQDVLIAAVLHDTVEDAGITVKTIENVFSAKVATLVDHLTHRDTVPKTEYIASFAAPNIPIEALLIKLADRICNVRDFTVDDPGYVSKYVQKGRPIFEAFLLRRKEIEDQFGPEVAKKAFFSWGQMLAGVQNSTLQQV